MDSTFICHNCHKTFPVTDAGEVSRSTKVGIFVLGVGQWWHATVCQSCEPKFTAIGVVVLMFLAASAAGWTLWWLLQ